MKRSELQFCNEQFDVFERFVGGDDQKVMSEKIALLIDENEKLRRIAVDLSGQTQRMRRSVAETS